MKGAGPAFLSLRVCGVPIAPLEPRLLRLPNFVAQVLAMSLILLYGNLGDCLRR
jgi:hypothetical protein